MTQEKQPPLEGLTLEELRNQQELLFQMKEAINLFINEAQQVRDLVSALCDTGKISSTNANILVDEAELQLPAREVYTQDDLIFVHRMIGKVQAIRSTLLLVN